MRSIRILTGGLLLSLLAAGRAAGADPVVVIDPERGGLVLRSEADGFEVAAPALGTTVEVRVTGVVARARVTQVFGNPTGEWLTGVYLFPLPDGAAVDALRLVAGGRVLEGVVQEKAEAQATFAAAAQEGRRASLLDQLRPGLFTTSVANVGPGETVEVVIEMQQVVRWERGRFVLRFPMLAAPRYAPPVRPEVSAAGCRPAVPRPPLAATPSNPFALHVDLSPGFPLARIESPTHAVVVEKDPERRRWAIDLADGVAPADGDFVLEWQAAVGRTPRAALFGEEIDGESYALLMVMPPDDSAGGEAAAARLPRETVFVIDTSGSMEGTAIEQARRALLLALGRLQPGDRFNVIEFDDAPAALFAESVPATAASLGQARNAVERLAAGGGTGMLAALERALQGPDAVDGLVQQVIFVTDGQVENETEILRHLSFHLVDRRLFTVALGAAPNVPFLRRAAELGRGSFTHVPSLDRVEAGMAELFARLEAPMLREIEVEWPDAAAEAWPQRAPDLYLGEPLVVAARLGGSGPVTVSGVRAGESWREELPAAAAIRRAGLDKLWAGRKTQALLDSLEQGADAEEVRREVTALGLRHHLVTPYTSLVAVDVDVTAPAGAAPVPALVPLNRPRGATPAVVTSNAGGGVVEDMIVVTHQSPLLDERRSTVGTTVGGSDPDRLPSAPDPWAVLQATPGVLVDRVGAGDGSGRRAAAVVGGAGAEQGQVRVDGVAVTYMSAIGASGSYLAFDSFEELQVTTGGADTSLETPGPRLSLWRPQGTNAWRGSARGLWSGHQPGAERSVEVGPPGAGVAPAGRLEALVSAGLEGGGPIVEDTLWFWASTGGDEVERSALGGQEQSAERRGGALKLNAAVASNASAVLAWTRGESGGAGIGAGPARSPETTLREDGREDLRQGEATYIANAQLFGTGALAWFARRLAETPQGTAGITIDAAGRAHGGWLGFDEERRDRTARLEAEGFASAGSGDHVLTVGAERRAQDEARAVAAPDLTIAGPTVGLPEGSALLELWRGDGRVEARSWSLWSQDQVTRGPLTAVVGLRLDRQDLGAGGFEPSWLALPRLGLTWSPASSGDILVRASLARFASRLAARAAWHADPGAPGALFARAPDPGAGLTPAPWAGDGLDPLQPAIDPDRLDPGLRPETTDEATLGVERTVGWDFVVGLRASLRRTRHLLDERLLVRDLATGRVFAAGAGDWVPAGRLTGTLPDGAAYDVPYWDLRPGLASTGGTFLGNGDRERDDVALTLHWQKRLSRSWMGRGHVTWLDGEQRLGPEFRRLDDPTDTLGADDDEGLPVTIVEPWRPHEAPRWLAARWSFHAAGFVQLPHGFGVAAAVNGREGYPLPYHRRIARDRAGLAAVQLTDRPDSSRTADVVTLDGRLDRQTTSGNALLTLSLEAFNLTGETTVLERHVDLGVTRGGFADDVLAPRTFRLGFRVEWR